MAFLGGITGQMYKQFAVTLVIAVVISGIVALTLTPALCAVLLEAATRANHATGFFGWFNRGFDRVTERYVARGGRGASRGPRAGSPCSS